MYPGRSRLLNSSATAPSLSASYSGAVIAGVGPLMMNLRLAAESAAHSAVVIFSFVNKLTRGHEGGRLPASDTLRTPPRVRIDQARLWSGTRAGAISASACTGDPKRRGPPTWTFSYTPPATIRRPSKSGTSPCRGPGISKARSARRCGRACRSGCTRTSTTRMRGAIAGAHRLPQGILRSNAAHREGLTCWERIHGMLANPGWRLDSTAVQASPHFASHFGRRL